MATESPMITPFPGAKLYRLTATQLEFLSVRQNVLGKKKENGKNIILCEIEMYGTICFHL